MTWGSFFIGLLCVLFAYVYLRSEMIRSSILYCSNHGSMHSYQTSIQFGWLLYSCHPGLCVVRRVPSW
jgi:hypothetical protein